MKISRLLTFLALCALTFLTLPLWPAAFAQGDVAAEAAKAGADEESKTLLSLIIKGGALMIPIAICSVIAVYVSIWQFLFLRRDQILPSGLQSHLRESLGAKGNDVKGGLAYCEKNRRSGCPYLQGGHSQDWKRRHRDRESN